VTWLLRKTPTRSCNGIAVENQLLQRRVPRAESLRQNGNTGISQQATVRKIDLQ
jgi:hypothetical protein